MLNRGDRIAPGSSTNCDDQLLTMEEGNRGGVRLFREWQV